MGKPVKHVFVCTQSRPPGHPRGSCGARGSMAVFQEFLQQFEKRGLWGKFAVTGSGCIGPCDFGPNVLVYPDGVMYGGVTKEAVSEIIEQHLLGGQPVESLKVPAEIWG
ncbi:MAG: (2Fe-2S) ferredoxin domain-containing protein [Pseudomonadota bacterium]